MRKLRLKDISIEKQMTVILPIVMGILLLIGTLMVNRVREVKSAGEMKQFKKAEVSVETLPLDEPLHVLLVLKEQENVFFTIMTLHPTVEITFANISDTQIKQLYKKEGVYAVSDTLKTTHYAVFDFVDWQRMFAVCGEYITVNLPERYTYRDTAGLQVEFPKGDVRLSGNQAVDLVRALVTTDTGGDVVAAMHKELFFGSLKTENAADVFSRFIDNAVTDMRIYHFEKYLPLIETLKTAL